MEGCGGGYQGHNAVERACNSNKGKALLSVREILNCFMHFSNHSNFKV